MDFGEREKNNEKRKSWQEILVIVGVFWLYLKLIFHLNYSLLFYLRLLFFFFFSETVLEKENL